MSTVAPPRVVETLTAAERDAKWMFVEGPEPQHVRSPGAVYSWCNGMWGMECSGWAGWKPLGYEGDVLGHGGRFMAVTA